MPPLMQARQDRGEACACDRIVYEMADEGFAQNGLLGRIPVGREGAEHLGAHEVLVVVAVLAADPAPDDQPVWVGDPGDDAIPALSRSQPGEDGECSRRRWLMAGFWMPALLLST